MTACATMVSAAAIVVIASAINGIDRTKDISRVITNRIAATPEWRPSSVVSLEIGFGQCSADIGCKLVAGIRRLDCLSGRQILCAGLDPERIITVVVGAGELVRELVDDGQGAQPHLADLTAVVDARLHEEEGEDVD